MTANVFYFEYKDDYLKFQRVKTDELPSTLLKKIQVEFTVENLQKFQSSQALCQQFQTDVEKLASETRELKKEHSEIQEGGKTENDKLALMKDPPKVAGNKM